MFHITLDRIRPNPWQTRQGPDPEHIAELAADIAARYETRPVTCGLLQVPLGRLVDAQGKPIPKADALALLHLGDVTPNLEGHDYYVQLAFGHNRLAAFTLLSNGSSPPQAGGIEGGKKFTRFPVEYADFTDAEMATAAWTENAKRRDLIALEEALAIRRAQADFGWSNTEISQRWGMAPSTISNKLRLLTLPDAVQTDIHEGAISERQAMAIIPIYELPDSLLSNVHSDCWYSPDTIVQLARDGRSSDYLRGRISDAIEHLTGDLTKTKFPLDDIVEGDDHPICNSCAKRISHKRVSRCTDEECYRAKTAAYKLALLAQASADLGLPVKPDTVKPWDKETFYEHPDIARALLDDHIAGKKQCDCLHIECVGNSWKSSTGHPLDKYGYPDLRVVCVYGDKGHCTCLSSAKSAATRKANANNEELQAKRARQKRVRDELIDPAVELLATAIRNNIPTVWLKILKNINRSSCDGGDEWPFDKIVKKIAFALLESHWKWNDDKYDRVHHNLSGQINALGLTNPWDTATRLEQVKLQRDRIENWTRDLSTNPIPPTAALKGNVENLTQLELELDAIESSDERAQIEERIVVLLDVFYDLIPITKRWDATEDGQEWDQHADWIVNVPAGDANFKSHLGRITRPNVVEYAGALLGMQQQTKTKTKLEALDRHLRLLEKPGEEVER